MPCSILKLTSRLSVHALISTANGKMILAYCFKIDGDTLINEHCRGEDIENEVPKPESELENVSRNNAPSQESIYLLIQEVVMKHEKNKLRNPTEDIKKQVVLDLFETAKERTSNYVHTKIYAAIEGKVVRAFIIGSTDEMLQNKEGKITKSLGSSQALARHLIKFSSLSVSSADSIKQKCKLGSPRKRYFENKSIRKDPLRTRSLHTLHWRRVGLHSPSCWKTIKEVY